MCKVVLRRSRMPLSMSGSVRSLLGWYDNLPSFMQVMLALGLLALVGLLDHFTGAELSFSIFYLAPVALVSWSSGPRTGLVFAALCALTWYAAEVSNNKVYSVSEIAYWNTAVRFGFFSVFNALVAAVRKELRVCL